MRRALVSCVMVAMAVGLATTAAAAPIGGWVSTDRFGYTGTVVRYGSLADAQTGTNPMSTTAIGNRDLSLYVVDNAPAFDSDFNGVMGSWWYTTDPSGSAGYGNTTGNSGRGFVQLYDGDASTDTTVDMAFSNFDGTYWTTYTLLLTGVNADYPNDYARFWVDYQGNGADKVIFHAYELSLTATGLEGTKVGNVISSSNHPTGVAGTFRGVFENVSTTYPANNGFYVFDLALDMTNWAYENRDSLTGQYPFADSEFGVIESVPEPGTLLLLGLGLVAGGRKLRRRA